ncbi:GntR family transcriptional regulator [Dinoroseobacter sp. PD6]|nr:GntR family transcriptional regulator [Dinoroseobacter sp. PD6]MDD9717070.1 GntR family transcriptional regulator [Dinoroseobacter sp. PD6]
MPPLSALPKHMQISEVLIRDITAGRLAEGARLPPERDLAVQMGTSVGTLRKALAHLTEQGLLHRVQGSGNYVRKGGPAAGVYAMFRLERRSGGGLPRAEMLDRALMDKPADLPAFGRVPAATRFRRLRALDDQPVAVEEIWLDASAGSLAEGPLSESLYRSYTARLGLTIQRAEDRVRLAPFPAWTPPQLAAPDTMAGFVERFAWAGPGPAIEYSRTWFDGTRAHYVQRLSETASQ